MTETSYEKIDAVVLAGTHLEKDKLIYGQNKSFLDFRGKPVVQWVIEALANARFVDRIVVVGPIEKVQHVREHSPIDFIPVEQRGQMINNAWVAFHALSPRADAYPTDFLEYQAAFESGTFKHPPDIDQNCPYLFISGDVPLVTPAAIDNFIEHCRPFVRDMYYGVSSEESLRPYYPTPKQTGIKRPYVNFSDERVRVANIQIVKPLKLGRLYLIQSGYTVRKLMMWRNIFRLIWLIIRLPYGMRAAGYIAMLQVSSLLYKYGLHKWAKPIVKRSKKDRMIWYMSHFLQTRFTMISTPFGGLSIDIDDEDDYKILKEFFVPWRELQDKIADDHVHEQS